MSYTKLPPVWRIGDFIAFGLGGIACIALLIYGAFGHVEGSTQWPYITAATAAAFFFIYWQVILIRKNDIKGFVLMGGTRYGFLVNVGEYKLPGGQVELERSIADVAKRWEVCFPSADIDKALTSHYIWVWFKPGKLDLPFNMPGKVAGYTIGNAKMVVGYLSPETQLDHTAFAHEIGHIIQGSITGIWDLETHHARSKKFGLP
jgi:hypothetical protein